jgi:hypothetical protein
MKLMLHSVTKLYKACYTVLLSWITYSLEKAYIHTATETNVVLQ